jgi:uncharacterized peroxidase-related enzyme
MIEFSMKEIDWTSWVEPMALSECTPEHLSALDISHRGARESAFYLTLVHDPAVLRERSGLFNAVMYGRDGLSRAEREFVTVVESRINGCPYCASVHARLYVQLSKDRETMGRLLDEGAQTPMSPRLRALADYAAALTATPPRADARYIDCLRSQGFSDVEILDATYAVSMFAWANRMMQTLGEPCPMPQPDRSGSAA